VLAFLEEVSYNSTIVATKKQTPLHHKIKHHVRMAVVPHKNNHYRPHLIRGHGIAIVVFLVVALQFGYNTLTTGNVLGDKAAITVGGLLDETNTARANSGEPSLVLNEKLTQAAYLKAEDMFTRQYWAHNAPDGTQPWKWLGDVGYNYAEAGENLAKGFSSNTATVSAWLHSSEHRANVLKPSYTQVGFATKEGKLQGKPTTVVVALYGTPAEVAVAGAQASFKEASTSSMSPIARVGYALRNLSPAALGSVVLIMLVAAVALLAHAYRKKLPKPLRQSWYRHHGLYKAVGMTSFALIIIALYNGGQI